MTKDGDDVSSERDRRLYELIGAYYSERAEGRDLDHRSLFDEHPDLADSLRTFFEQQDRFHRAVAPLRVAAGTEVAAGDGTDLGAGRRDGSGNDEAKSFGDFMVVSELGRGGMGIVYEAWQRSLGRRVALKVLPNVSAMDPGLRRRFQTEASAAAQMRHPNIVPVYTVGSDHGMDYYAMQLVDGETLGQLIASRRHAARTAPGFPEFSRRDDWNLAATLGIQAAQALDHAHGLGIVHRDIKPANLIVDPRGKLWVTDFGLALVQGNGELTLTGETLGTLRYMSPEQALAKRGYLDHRTDIYSLGATLYELITLRPAIQGSDRHEILQRIASEEPAPPRRLDPAIPRPLETIVLKAMAKAPDARYATARELADDLRRFLADEPIMARRPTAWERAQSWGRRHPEFTAASLGALVLGILLLAVTAVLVNRERARTAAALERMTQQEQAARDQAIEARENADFVLQGITEPLKKLANPDLEQFPGFVQTRRDAVDEAIAVYEEFLRTAALHSAGVPEEAGVRIHIGLLHTVAGDHEKAQEAFKGVIRFALRRAVAEPASDSPLFDLMGGHAHLGMELWEQGHRDEAIPHFRAARAAIDRILARYPDATREWNYLAWFLSLVPDPQFRDPGLALRLARGVVAATSEVRDNRGRLSRGVRPRFLLGLAEYRAGDLASARRSLERSMDLRDGGDAYEWFVMAMVLARQGLRDQAHGYHLRANRWMRRYRYSDFELHFLDEESAAMLGIAGGSREEAAATPSQDVGCSH